MCSLAPTALIFPLFLPSLPCLFTSLFSAHFRDVPFSVRPVLFALFYRFPPFVFQRFFPVSLCFPGVRSFMYAVPFLAISRLDFLETRRESLFWSLLFSSASIPYCLYFPFSSFQLFIFGYISYAPLSTYLFHPVSLVSTFSFYIYKLFSLLNIFYHVFPPPWTNET